jgi:hypothetical protein
MKKTFAFVLSLSASSLAFIAEAGAQSRQMCRLQCNYIESFGPDTGKASQTPAVNACYRACMKRTGAARADARQR